jgi:hypothetical protein
VAARKPDYVCTVKVNMEALFIHPVEMHAAVVVMMMCTFLRVSNDVAEALRRCAQELRSRKRLANDGQERQEDR